MSSAEDPEATHEASHRSTPAEIELLARLRDGDEAAFAGLVERHHGALLRLACIFVSTRAVAEEVVQETWEGVIDGLPAFEGRSSLKTWIFRILTNRAKTRGAREGRSVPFSAFGDGDGDPGVGPDGSRFRPDGAWAEPPRLWDGDTPERLAMQSEALRRLETALEELPASQRAVVTLRDVDGLDPAEVCNVLAISETNQRVLLHRARSRLRAVLQEYVDGK